MRNLTDHPQIAIDLDHPATHRACQLKGQVLASRPAVLCFVGSGVAMALAITALNQALLLGQIVVVVPVVSASPVFTMLLSILVFRRERVTGRLVAAVCVVVPSVIVIALGR